MKNILKYSENIWFSEMKSSKSIKYLEDMCWTDPGTVFPLLSIISCARLQNLGSGLSYFASK
jgi:hypothetical protein